MSLFGSRRVLITGFLGCVLRSLNVLGFKRVHIEQMLIWSRKAWSFLLFGNSKQSRGHVRVTFKQTGAHQSVWWRAGAGR